MDPIGLSIGVVGVAGQLVNVGLQCFDILSETRDFATDHDSFVWQLSTERHRLKGWEEAWDVRNGLDQKLDPNDYRYRYAVGTLARIVSLFSSAESLGTKYGIQATANGQPGRFDKITGNLSFLRRPRSRKSLATSSKAAPLPGLDVLGGLNLDVLDNEDLVPGLAQEIVRLKETTEKMQQVLPLYRKLRWVVTDKAKSSELIGQLKRYNDGLFAILSPESTLVRPFSKFKIPMQLLMQRNQSFCGRDELLERMHGILKPKVEISNMPADPVQLVPRRRIVILHGLGGMGKTQLAAEYAYRYSVGTSYSSIFWIDATSQASLARSALVMAEQIVSHYATKWRDSGPSFAEIGIMLGLPGCVEETGRIKPDIKSPDLVVKAMTKWLSNAENKNWLVIFDNNDDVNSVKIRDFFPTCDFGSIIVTTRNSELKRFGDAIEVEGIEQAAGISILMRSAGQAPIVEGDKDYAQAAEIAKRLGYLPLALDQAGGYISTKGIPLSSYLPLYTANYKLVASKSHLGLEDSYRNDTIFTTWKITFDSLPRPARELLLLCAFLGTSDIPGELFYRGKEVILEVFKDADFVDDAIGPLLSYSLAKRQGLTSPRDLSFHPLVLEWARESQEVDSMYPRYSRWAVSLVGATYTESKGGKRTTDDWVFALKIFTYIEISLNRIRTVLYGHMLFDDESAATILEQIGGFCGDHGLYKDEEELLQKALTICKKCSSDGKLTPQMTRVMSKIGWVHIHLARYKQALEVFEEVASSRQEELGNDNPSTWEAYHNVAVAFTMLEMFDESVELNMQVLEKREGGLGVDHPGTLKSIHNLAVALRGLGRYEQAVKLYEQVLASEEEILGKDHPDTMLTLLNMGVALHGLERYDEEEKLLRRVLANRERILGKKHVKTLEAGHHLALALRLLNRHEESVELSKQVLRDREQVLGFHHRETLATSYNMTFPLRRLGRYEEAIEYYEQVLDASPETKLGIWDEETLDTAYHLNATLQELEKQQRWQKLAFWKED